MATKRKKSKAKPKRPNRPSTNAPFSHTRRLLDCAHSAFYEEKDPKKALEQLQRIDAQGYLPNEALQLYLEVACELEDHDQFSRLATMFVDRCPRDPIAYLCAAEAALKTFQPVSGILYYEQFLKLAPEHPQRANVESEVARLRKLLPGILDAFVDDLPKDPQRVASVEKILHHLKLACLADVIRLAEKHLKTYPTDCKVRNNLAEALANKGDEQQARKIIGGTLELSPNNFFALAVRSRMAFFQGQTEQCRADADKLKTLEPRQVSDLTKAAQLFAFVGDDDGVRWAYTEAKRRDWLKNWPADEAQLTNYYGTSLARAGAEEVAQSHWKHAVKLAGTATTASENLEDLRKPAGERYGAAYSSIHDWISRSQLDEMRVLFESESKKNTSAQQVDNCALRFLAKHPGVERVLPDMLDRGDAHCQQIALILARGSKREAVTKALLDYVRGTRGTDAMRYQLLMTLKKQGHEFECPVSIYVGGKLQQVELFDFNISDEPVEPIDRPDEVKDLVYDALQALLAHDGVTAERFLRQVRQMVPDSPDVLNNLGFALAIQGRRKESEALADEVIQKFPDYFFSKIIVANRFIQRAKYDEAHEVLKTLYRRKLLHRTEFIGLARAMIHLHVGKLELGAAQHWFNMFRDYDPDHPELEELATLIASRQNRSFLKRLVRPFG